MRIRLSTIIIGCLSIGFYWASCSMASKTEQGEFLYNKYCENCHMANGEGLAELYPPLNKSDYLVSHRNELACQIRHGLKGPIIVNGIEYDMAMPANQKLTEVEINNILNYIYSAWDNKLPASNVEEVKQQLSICPKRYE